MTGMDPGRFWAVVSPLRRALLAAAREREGLPDLPEAQVEVLRLLPRGTTAAPGDLARLLGVRRSTISNLLATMEASGLVGRQRHSHDGRRVEVAASERALSLVERFDVAAAELVTSAVRSLPPEQQRAVADALPALEALRDHFTESRRAGAPVRAEEAS